MSRLLGLGALVGLWTVTAGLGVVAAAVLVAWVGNGAEEPLTDALSVAALGWALGTGATLSTSDAAWSLMPLGLTLLTVGLAYRGGLWAGDAGRPISGSRVAAVVVAASGTAGVLGGVVATLSTVDALVVDPGEAAAFAAGLTGVGTLTGVVSAAPQWRAELVGRLPAWLTAASRPLVVAAAVLTAGAVATATVATVASFGTVTTLLEQLDPGPAGLFALLLACLAYLPTAWVWTLAVLVGPGVTIGQVTISSASVAAGPLPGFPLLGVVPSSLPSWTAPVGVLVMVAAGASAGAFAAWRAPQEAPRWAPAATAATAGLGTAVALAVATWATRGSVGPGDLADVGAQPAPVSALGGVVVTSAAALTAVVLTWRRQRGGADEVTARPGRDPDAS